MDDETQTPTAADAPTAEQEERGEAVWVRGEGAKSSCIRGRPGKPKGHNTQKHPQT